MLFRNTRTRSTYIVVCQPLADKADMDEWQLLESRLTSMESAIRYAKDANLHKPGFMYDIYVETTTQRRALVKYLRFDKDDSYGR